MNHEFALSELERSGREVSGLKRDIEETIVEEKILSVNQIKVGTRLGTVGLVQSRARGAR